MPNDIDRTEPGSEPSPDRAIRVLLVAGAIVAGGNLVALGVLWTTDPALFSRIVAVLAAAYAGGRMAGILTGLELGLGNAEIAATIILLNTGWLLLALPLFRLVTTRIDPPKRLAAFFRRAERRARSRSRRVRALGLAGLVLFIWLPFPFSGAFAGALIGLLMGVPLARLVPIVLVTMWIGVVTWTWGIDAVVLFTGTAGRIAAWVVTVGLVVYSLVIRLRARGGER